MNDPRFDPATPTPVTKPESAPVRGSRERRDFRARAEPVDPGAFASEAMARAQAAADRRSQAIERDQQPSRGPAALPPSADAHLAALERRIHSLEADAIVMRARLAALEGPPPAKSGVHFLPKPEGGSDPELPGAA